jgi:hypothetical protein
MSPTTGAENHGADTLLGRGDDRGARQGTIPGILARAGQYRGNMEPRHGQVHKHRQGQCREDHSFAAQPSAQAGGLAGIC